MPDNPSPPKLARRASVCIAVAAALTCALVLPGQVAVWLLADARTFRELTDAMTVHTVLMLTVGGLALLSWIVAAVSFFRWSTRYHAAVERLPETTLRYRRDWVVAAWFLPAVNLVLPALVVADVARASGVRRPGLVVWGWWVSFVTAVAALVLPTVGPGTHTKQAVAFFTFGDDIDPEFRAGLIAFHRPQYDRVLPALALLLVAAALAIVMVRAFTAAQAGHQDLDAGSASPFLPLQQLSRLATAAVVVVTAVLLSPAWLPDSALQAGDAVVSSDSAACDAGQHDVAAPCLGAYVDAEPGRETSAAAAVVVDDARFDPSTVPGLIAWSLLVGGVACFLWWLARARRNLDGFPDARPRWSAGWSWGAWLIPGAGPVIGAFVVSDIARESHPSSGGAGATGTPARYEAVRLVWACAVLAMAWPFTYPPVWPAPPFWPTVGWLPTTIVLALTALLAIAVIRRVTAAQHRRLVEEPPAPPEA